MYVFNVYISATSIVGALCDLILERVDYENEGLANNFMKEGKTRDFLVMKQALGGNG